MVVFCCLKVISFVCCLIVPISAHYFLIFYLKVVVLRISVLVDLVTPVVTVVKPLWFNTK